MTKKNFFNWKLKNRFFGLAAIMLSYGLALTSCDTAVGTAPDDEGTVAAVGADSSSGKETEVGEGTDSSSGKVTEVVDSSGRKTIDVKFEVENGGGGLGCSAGIVSTQDDTYLVRDGDSYYYDFTITITVPASDQYLNIRWRATEYEFLTYDTKKKTYVTAKMPVGGASKYTIGLDYNGVGSVSTSNLYDVHVDANYDKVNGIDSEQLVAFHNAWNRAIDD